MVNIIIILISVAADALRDRWMPERCKGLIWWRWHIVKWISVFTLWVKLCFDIVRSFDYSILAIAGVCVLGIGCRYLWRGIYGGWRRQASHKGDALRRCE